MSEAREPGDRAPAGTTGHGETTPLATASGGPPPPAASRRSAAGIFFGVLVRPRSWLNLLYLLLSFPLGVFYFVVLVTLLAVGIGLVIIWVGIFVLALTAAAWWAFASFERSLADGLLRTQLQPAPRPWQSATGTWPRIKAHFTSLATWKDLAFLFLKFPLGIASFCIVVTLGAASVALIAAPLYYSHVQWTGVGGTVTHGLDFGVWTVDRLWQALLLVPLGALLLIVSMHVFNGLAAVWRAVARGLLETADRPQAQPAPAASGPVIPPQTQTLGWDPYSYPPPSATPYQGQSPYQGQAPYAAQPPYQGQPSYQAQPPYPGQPTYPAQPPYQGQPSSPAQPPYQGQPSSPAQPPYQGQPLYPPPPYPGQSPAPYPQPPSASQAYPSSAPHPSSALPTPPWGEWPALYGPPAAAPAKPDAATPDAPASEPDPRTRGPEAPATRDAATPDAATRDERDRGPEAPATTDAATPDERSPAEPASHDEPPAEEERP